MSAMPDEPGDRGELSRLADLRQQAGAVYDAIAAADSALRALAGRRVAAERSLRVAWGRYRLAARALEAHAQAKPGPRALAATGFAAGREWRGRRELLAGAVRDHLASVEAARRAVAAVQAEFAATMQARAVEVAALRRLTAECAAALAATAGERDQASGRQAGVDAGSPPAAPAYHGRVPAQPSPGPGNAGCTLATAHWPEVEAGARRVLVVPVGSLEQHGAHLPLDTDTRIAVAVARRACAGRDGAALAPAIPIGASGEHADFPGTLSIGRAALSGLLVELGRHASLHWPSMLLVNGHGGNVAAIGDALGQLRAEGRDCHAWHAGVRPAWLAAAGLTLAPDAHAGRVETSVMLALAPGDVRLDAAAAGETRPLAQIMPALRAGGVREVSPNGVLGDPAGASAAEGEALLTLLTADLAATLDRLAARPPG
jgi:mycofactocin system creatininase family protein